MPRCHYSGQIMIFHQPRFPWNKEISLTKPPFEVRSCEVAIICPDYSSSHSQHRSHDGYKYLQCPSQTRRYLELPLLPSLPVFQMVGQIQWHRHLPIHIFFLDLSVRDLITNRLKMTQVQTLQWLKSSPTFWIVINVPNVKTIAHGDKFLVSLRPNYLHTIPWDISKKSPGQMPPPRWVFHTKLIAPSPGLQYKPYSKDEWQAARAYLTSVFFRKEVGPTVSKQRQP